MSLGYPTNFRFSHFLSMLPIFIIVVGKSVFLPYYFNLFLTTAGPVCSQSHNTHSENENTFVAHVNVHQNNTGSTIAKKDPNSLNMPCTFVLA